MKSTITVDAWEELELILIKYGIGYVIEFKDVDGVSKMVIRIDTLEVVVNMEE